MAGLLFGVPVVEWIGAAIAGLTAAGMIGLDCHQVLSSVARYVPDKFFRSTRVLGLAAGGGAMAGALYLLTTPSGHDPISRQIGLTQASALLRAFGVGVVALALIRSKFFKLPQGDFGGEYIYIQLRQSVLQPIILGWNVLKASFVQKNLDVCLAIPNFVDDTLETIRQVVAAIPGQAAGARTTEFDEVVKAQPKTDFSSAAPEWRLYYRTVIRFALDSCGPDVFSGSQFAWPT